MGCKESLGCVLISRVNYLPLYKLYPPTSSPSSNLSSISESSSESSEFSSSSIPKINPEWWEPQHTLLLAPEAVPAIIPLFELESTIASADLHRAVEKVRI